jgi:hypothetical protein
MNLKHTHGRVVVSVALEFKNSHKFEDGTTIRLERQFNEFNKRITEPVNAIVVSADNIPVGAEILIAHNCTHDVNKVFDYENLSGELLATDTKYFSIPESDCFLWRMGGDKWQPIGIYETALRVFKPYEGPLEGVEPELIKNALFVTSGDYEGLVVRTLVACDYEIIFQNEHGREERIIRFRPDGDEEAQREPEAICVDHGLTEKVVEGELLVGLSIKDCKQLELVYG